MSEQAVHQDAVPPQEKSNPYAEIISKAREGQKKVRRSRKLMTVEELPKQQLLWGETARGLNNQIARSALFGISNKTKKRELMQRVELYNYGTGKITYSGPDLRQDDEDVFFQILHVSRQIDLNNKIEFSGYQFLKQLGWQPNSKNYDRLRGIITNLAGAVVEVEHEERLCYGSALIQSYQFESNIPGDEKSRKWQVKLDRQILALFQDTLFTQLDWNMRMKFRRQLTKKLHSFYSTHREPYAIKVETIHKLCRSEIAKLYTFRQELKLALDELVEFGFLVSYSIDKKTDMVHVNRNLSLIETKRAIQPLLRS